MPNTACALLVQTWNSRRWSRIFYPTNVRYGNKSFRRTMIGSSSLRALHVPKIGKVVHVWRLGKWKTPKGKVSCPVSKLVIELVKLQHQNYTTEREISVTEGYFNQLLQRIIALNSVTCSVGNGRNVSAILLLTDAWLVVQNQFALCRSLESLGLGTRIVRFHKRPKRLHGMSVSTVYEATSLLPPPLKSFSQKDLLQYLACYILFEPSSSYILLAFKEDERD